MYTMVVVLVVFGSPQTGLSSGASSNIFSLDFPNQEKCQAAARRGNDRHDGKDKRSSRQRYCLDGLMRRSLMRRSGRDASRGRSTGAPCRQNER
jgi:hypothetical protein